MKKLSKKYLHKILENGEILDSWPCDIGLDKKAETNGSEEHIIYYEGNFYILIVSWEGDTIIDSCKLDLNECLNIEEIDSIGKIIIEYMKARLK